MKAIKKERCKNRLRNRWNDEEQIKLELESVKILAITTITFADNRENSGIL